MVPAPPWMAIDQRDASERELGNRALPLEIHLQHEVTRSDGCGTAKLVALVLGVVVDPRVHRVRRGDRETRKQWALNIAEKCSAELVQSIGQVACFYKRHPEKPVVDPGK